MSYDIHITRQKNWFDDDDERKISLKEWTTLVENDQEMRQDNYAVMTTTSGELLKKESEGLCVWTEYSENVTDGEYAWFEYNNGNIVCKNPDDEILQKILKIATQLSAKAQGEKGEEYE